MQLIETPSLFLLQLEKYLPKELEEEAIRHEEILRFKKTKSQWVRCNVATEIQSILILGAIIKKKHVFDD